MKCFKLNFVQVQMALLLMVVLIVSGCSSLAQPAPADEASPIDAAPSASEATDRPASEQLLNGRELKEQLEREALRGGGIVRSEAVDKAVPLDGRELKEQLEREALRGGGIVRQTVASAETAEVVPVDGRVLKEHLEREALRGGGIVRNETVDHAEVDQVVPLDGRELKEQLEREALQGN